MTSEENRRIEILALIDSGDPRLKTTQVGRLDMPMNPETGFKCQVCSAPSLWPTQNRHAKWCARATAEAIVQGLLSLDEI